MAGEKHIPFELTLLRKDGVSFQALVRCSRLIRQDRHTGMRVSIVDISDVKAIQDRLGRSEERFRRVFGNSVTGMAIFVEGGTVLESNAAFQRIVNPLLGGREEGAFLRLDAVFPELAGPAGTRGAGSLMFEKAFETAGGPLCVEVNVVVLNPSVTPSVYLAEIHDITARVLNERAVIDSAAKAVKRAEAAAGLLQQRLAVTSALKGFVYQSQAVARVIETLPQIAETAVSVLITGESGTGKELVARAIHELSPRRGAAFVALNCAAIPANLLESELFGYKAGAFTDAKKDTPGKFQLADGGTLFLDEIGDLAPALQAKLLRVLQDREFFPLGWNKAVRIDVRIISATNRDLKQMIAGGAFRADLYYRIQVVSLALPALRERAGDIPILVNYFLSRLCAKYGRSIQSVDPDALAALAKHPFPGNVRELENIIEQAVVFCRGDTLRLSHLPADLLSAHEPVPQPGEPAAPDKLDDIERRHILEAIRLENGNKTAAARRLGIHKTTLLRKLKEMP
jgi:transcriptional regulator with PAS, ATPase and Fis domain